MANNEKKKRKHMHENKKYVKVDHAHKLSFMCYLLSNFVNEFIVTLAENL